MEQVSQKFEAVSSVRLEKRRLSARENLDLNGSLRIGRLHSRDFASKGISGGDLSRRITEEETVKETYLGRFCRLRQTENSPYTLTKSYGSGSTQFGSAVTVFKGHLKHQVKVIRYTAHEHTVNYGVGYLKLLTFRMTAGLKSR